MHSVQFNLLTYRILFFGIRVSSTSEDNYIIACIVEINLLKGH